MAELKGIEYLKNKLAGKRPRVELRYEYYEQKHRARDFGISTPEDLLNLRYNLPDGETIILTFPGYST